jgi:GntR family transcriptional repressor for pyruvate dehydrogenase complex
MRRAQPGEHLIARVPSDSDPPLLRADQARLRRQFLRSLAHGTRARAALQRDEGRRNDNGREKAMHFFLPLVKAAACDACGGFRSVPPKPEAQMRASSVKRSGLADQVIAQIRALVANGTYKVGDRLPAEPQLSDMFDVGRSTIREAIRVLSNRGIVDVRHGDGTYVAARASRESFEERLGRAALKDIYEARLFLELALAELAARRRTAKDVAIMRKCLKQRAEAIRTGNVSRYANADFAFHLAVAKAARSPALFGVYESFVQTVRPLLIGATTPEYIRDEGDKLHHELCGAIARSDVNETRRLVRSHLTTSLRAIGKRLKRT